MTIRVLLADDHKVVRAGIRGIPGQTGWVPENAAEAPMES